MATTKEEKAREDRDQNLMRIPEVVAKLGLSRATVYQLIDRGELPVVRFGRAVRIRPDDLARLVEQHRV